MTRQQLFAPSVLVPGEVDGLARAGGVLVDHSFCCWIVAKGGAIFYIDYEPIGNAVFRHFDAVTKVGNLVVIW